MKAVIDNLMESDKAYQRANHLLSVTFPLIKNKNLLIKIVQEIKNSVTKTVVAVLQYEYMCKRIKITPDPERNFQIFEEECAKKYEITQKELEQIRNLFELTKKQKESVMDIMKNDKVIHLSKDLTTETITPEKAKEFLDISRGIFQKTKEYIIKERKKN